MEFGSSEIDGEQCVRVIIRHQGADSMQAHIRELKNQDPHTGLLNRHTFMHRLDQLLDRGQNQPDALLMMLSIDNFTQINDEAGMIKSDCLLKETADLLALHVDDRELLGRFGDHQFIAVIRAHSSPEVTRQGYLETFQRARLEQCCELPTAPRFSIGLTPVPDGDRESAHELVRRCIHASREENATQHSAGLIEQGAPDDSGVPIDRNIVDLIDHALENDHFVLEYQPMVSLDGDTRENYSVFVRLLDQTDTPRDPEWFFGQAMHTERMAEIDRWVVRRTISELSRRRSSGEKVKGSWLYFLFEFSLLQEQPPELERFIGSLKKINCRISCNNVAGDATDYSVLEHYQVDMARLSPSLVKGLTTDAGAQDRLASINSRIQGMNIRTVATGIEDANTLALLWTIGVNHVQGWFLQEPLTDIDAGTGARTRQQA